MYERTLYCCEHCDEEFYDEDECLEHEKKCAFNFDSEPEAIDACGTCNRCTAEGYYDPDCKLKYAVLPRVECPDHVRAVR